MVHALDNIENEKNDYIAFIKKIRNMMHEVNAGTMVLYEVIEQIDSFIGHENEGVVERIIYAEKKQNLNEMSELEKVCLEWSNVSQNNYQLAKKYKKVLDAIIAPKYGLQGIMEDYSDHDSPEYLKEVLDYYRDLSRRYENLARQSLK